MNIQKRAAGTNSIVLTGMFAAILAVMSQIALPLPSGVPLTLQTLAVAMTGFVLGWRLGTASTAVYVLMGAVGVPVYSGFTGGPGILFGKTGGFLFGFIFMALLCGIAGGRKSKGVRIVLAVAGLALCHFLGTIQFMVLTGMGFAESLLLVSVPYLVKDILSVAGAWLVSVMIKRALGASGMLYNV